MPAKCVFKVPSMTVGAMKVDSQAGEEAAILLNFPNPLYLELSALATHNISVVHAGLETSPDTARLTVAIMIKGFTTNKGFNRYSIIGVAKTPRSEPHFIRFMRFYQRHGSFVVKLAKESETSTTQVSVWGMHLPGFEADLRQKILRQEL